MCDLSSVSIVYPCYWIGWCVHVIHITHPNPQVRIHTYTGCLSHTRVATHMCPGAVWQREKYIYLKTVSQLSKFVQSVLFTDIHSIRLWAQAFCAKEARETLSSLRSCRGVVDPDRD